VVAQLLRLVEHDHPPGPVPVDDRHDESLPGIDVEGVGGAVEGVERAP
jgi:hypothetical protein